jgi:hypothetical protein
MRRYILAAIGGTMLLGGGAWLRLADSRAQEPGPAAEKVARARETAKMLDDLYKNFVVHITGTYVAEKRQPPAARVALKVFQAMKDKGWHTGKLIDGTGDPVNPANAPKTAFEKQAIAAMKTGKAWHEEIDNDPKRPVLRVATIVPVVMKQCITCHPGTKEGDLLGALVYEVPIK